MGSETIDRIRRKLENMKYTWDNDPGSALGHYLAPDIEPYLTALLDVAEVAQRYLDAGAVDTLKQNDPLNEALARLEKLCGPEQD